MRFGENFLEELKTRIRPSDVVGRHVKLKRQGREFAGLSPFTNEKTPSFFVNDDKGFYHCFSSGKHGDAISFLMEIEGLSFPEAVEQLANMAGMALPKEDPDAERKAARRKVAVNWMDQTQLFFARALRADDARAARDYLIGRGLGPEDWDRFGIGFAPDSFSALKDALTEQGAPLDLLVNTGMLVRPDDNNRAPWDRFRNRIMFPIRDPQGRLVAFGGRAMDKDAKAKYLNSPETDIFHKGRVLYRYPEARKALAKPQHPARGLLVAEGYMDVIALARAGFEHAVAPLGTALTEDQLGLLWRAGPEPVLCFDGDAAGMRAAYRSVERALPLVAPGQSLRFALMPSGQDPDDVIRNKGGSAMSEILDKAVPLVDMLWGREVQAGPLETPEDKADLKRRLFAALNQITHDDVKTQYRTELLNRFDQSYGRQARNQGTYGKGGYGARKSKAFLSPQDKADMATDALRGGREERLIGAILLWPALLDRCDQAFFEAQFQDDALNALQQTILSYMQRTKEVEKQPLHAHIEREGLNTILRKLVRNRILITAGMGGADADLNTRADLWMKEADALWGQIQGQSTREYDRSRIADNIREDNVDGHRRATRASWANRR